MGGVHVTCMEVREALWNWFSPTFMWVLGLKLRLSNLSCASTLTLSCSSAHGEDILGCDVFQRYLSQL